MIHQFVAVLLALILVGCGGGDSVNSEPDQLALDTIGAASRPGPAPQANRKHILAVSASVDALDAASQLFDWAEDHFTEYFPSHQTNRAMNGWVYRYYPESKTYLAVIDWHVYVLGGPFGTGVIDVGNLTDYFTPVATVPAGSALTAASLARCPESSAVSATNFYLCMRGYLVGTQSFDMSKVCTFTVGGDGKLTLVSGEKKFTVGPTYGSVLFSKDGSTGYFEASVTSPITQSADTITFAIRAKSTANFDFLTEGGVLSVDALDYDTGAALTCDFAVAKN